MNHLEAVFVFSEGFELPLRIPLEEGFLASFRAGLVSGFRADLYEPAEDAAEAFRRGVRFAYLVRRFCRLHGLDDAPLRHFTVRFEDDRLVS